jgi:hypothetical protein
MDALPATSSTQHLLEAWRQIEDRVTSAVGWRYQSAYETPSTGTSSPMVPSAFHNGSKGTFALAPLVSSIPRQIRGHGGGSGLWMVECAYYALDITPSRQTLTCGHSNCFRATCGSTNLEITDG